MENSTETDLLSARAEFYLCLSRAFLVPEGDAIHQGMRTALADDLEDLAGLIGYQMSSAITTYRKSIAGVESPLELLQIYSGLFLAAPRTAHINTAVYLDGSVNGGSVAAIESEYREYGLARSESLRDLPDHASVQLEFVATLYARAGAGEDIANDPEAAVRDFLARYIGRWVGPWILHLDEAAIERRLTANPYAALARILEIAVVADALARPIPEAQARREAAMRKARHDRAVRGIEDEDLALITEKLRAVGLSTEHLKARSAMLEPKSQLAR